MALGGVLFLEVAVANFKRHRPKQQVACTMCTQDRWRGNHAGRFKAREEAARRAGADEPRARTKSPKRNWSANKKIRSLTGRLKHLRPKYAAYVARGRGCAPAWLHEQVRAYYAKEIAHCEKELESLSNGKTAVC